MEEQLGQRCEALALEPTARKVRLGECGIHKTSGTHGISVVSR